jgi:hypothetical protein
MSLFTAPAAGRLVHSRSLPRAELSWLTHILLPLAGSCKVLCCAMG